MILCDTSIWIRYFRKAKDPIVERFISLLLENKVCTNEFIYLEILQGIRNEDQFHLVKKLLLSLPFLKYNRITTINFAIDIFRKCNSKTPILTKPMDSIIAANTIENNVELFHCDKDFDLITKYFPLKIYQF
ncbi:MAG: PIN domain nuclease [Bacteroidetes bacterium]|nr:PIN domain nuclease [Bacteroidota bacterium]MBU2583981.1 PIN domain nuclease [Bacteroidota bacterium]